jgi:hypothetical protein
MTDSMTPTMLGCKKEFVAYVLKVNPNVKLVHCKSSSGKT